MSRLDKARAYKKKKVLITKFVFISFLFLLIMVIIIGTFNRGLFTDRSGRKEVDLIDMEKSAAFIDMFELTYIRLYLKEGKTASSVTANDEQFEYKPEEDRWDLTLKGYNAGEKINITVISENNSEKTQNVVLIIEEL